MVASGEPGHEPPTATFRMTKNGMVEDPARARGEIGRGSRLVRGCRRRRSGPGWAPTRPRRRGSRRRSAGPRGARTIPWCCRAGAAPGRVQASVHRRGLAADVLHDVDLAAGRPAHGRDVGSEQPERGPDPLAVRDLHAPFEAPVGVREKPLRLQARRRVGPLEAVRTREGLAVRDDHQVAVAVERGVGGPIGVRLELLVAPAAAADVERPPAAIDAGSRRAVELVAPDERPRTGCRSWPGRVGNGGSARDERPQPED